MSTESDLQDPHEEEVGLHLELDRAAFPRTWLTRVLDWYQDSKSTLVVLWVLLMSEAVRGIIIPTQSKFIQYLDGDESFVGLTVGAFSGGRLGMTILLGLLSGVLSYRTMFLSTSFLLMISNTGYALAGLARSKWLIFVSRIGLGLGAGTLSLVRAYFAESYNEANRTTILAVAAAVQYGGFALFPGLGDLLDLLTAKLGLNLDQALANNQDVNVVFNEYTAPAWLMIVLNFVSIVALWLAFREPSHKPFDFRDLIPFYIDNPHRASSGAIRRSILRAFGMESSPTSGELNVVPYDSSSSDRFSHELERLDWPNEPEKAEYGGKDDADVPSLRNTGKVPFVKSTPINSNDEANGETDHTEESVAIDLEASDSGSDSDPQQPSGRTLTFIWLSFLFINFLIRVILGTVEVLGATLFDQVTAKYIPEGQDTFTISSGTYYTILGAVGVGVVIGLAVFAKKLPDKIPFLASILALLLGSLTLISKPQSMSLVQFTLGAGMMYSIGYPLAQSVVVSIFSKIPNSKRNQAVSMSWIGSAGSVGRIVGPIVVGAIFQRFGAPATFIFNSSVAALLLLLSIITLRFMGTMK